MVGLTFRLPLPVSKELLVPVNRTVIYHDLFNLAFQLFRLYSVGWYNG